MPLTPEEIKIHNHHKMMLEMQDAVIMDGYGEILDDAADRSIVVSFMLVSLIKKHEILRKYKVLFFVAHMYLEISALISHSIGRFFTHFCQSAMKP